MRDPFELLVNSIEVLDRINRMNAYILVVERKLFREDIAVVIGRSGPASIEEARIAVADDSSPPKLITSPEVAPVLSVRVPLDRSGDDNLHRLPA